MRFPIQYIQDPLPFNRLQISGSIIYLSIERQSDNAMKGTGTCNQYRLSLQELKLENNKHTALSITDHKGSLKQGMAPYPW